MATLLSNSPAQMIVHNGIGVFESLRDLPAFATPHTLQLTMLIVCRTGEIRGTIDLTPRVMHAESIMVLRSGHVIQEIRQSADFNGFFILADNDMLDGILPMMTYMAPCMAYFKDNPIVPVSSHELHNISLMHELLTRKNNDTSPLPYNQLTVNALCNALFFETLGIYTTAMNRKNRTPSRREELLSQFIALVESDYRTERSVNYYADKLCLSPKHLSSVVKAASGLTAGQWIDRKVILEAKLMLRNSGMTIQEVSTALNFPNQSFFGKYFKHLTGYSPREFRTNPNA